MSNKFRLLFIAENVIHGNTDNLLMSSNGNIFFLNSLDLSLIKMNMEKVKVLRFTGITNVDGVEIYEDHIVKSIVQNEFGSNQVMIGRVHFCPGYKGWTATRAITDEHEDHTCWTIDENTVVIGNIHQTPGLLA